MATVPFNFLGLPSPYCDYDRARYVVLPIPYDSTVSYRSGSREGPFAIIAASRQVELFDTALGKEIYHPGVATAEPLEPDAGSADQMMEQIYRHARKIVKDGKFLLGLGGEHSVSGPLIRAVRTRHKKLSVVHIDAHLDMRDTWLNTKSSHACVIRRVHEMGINTVSAGIRNVSQEEHRYLKKNKSLVFTAEEIRFSSDEGWIDRAVEQLNDQVYVTIDIDGFDPSYAPGTGTPEPGGMDWYEVTRLLQRVAKERTIVGADIVEVLPVPGQVVTEFLAAKLAARIIAMTQ